MKHPDIYLRVNKGPRISVTFDAACLLLREHGDQVDILRVGKTAVDPKHWKGLRSLSWKSTDKGLVPTYSEEVI